MCVHDKNENYSVHVQTVCATLNCYLRYQKIHINLDINPAGVHII